MRKSAASGVETLAIEQPALLARVAPDCYFPHKQSHRSKSGSKPSAAHTPRQKRPEKDVVVALDLESRQGVETVPVGRVPEEKMIFDVGSQTCSVIGEVFSLSKTLLWNGPLGVFEVKPFDTGTVSAAKSVAKLTNSGSLISVAGGGDTLAALDMAGVMEGFSHVSTGGGAFLEWLKGDLLPGIEALIANRSEDI